MPSIAHLMLGGVFGICLYAISDGKFTKKHVFIFFLNNYLGPDVGWAIGLGYYTHYLLGWFFFAFALALFYNYFTTFTIKLGKGKMIEIIDLEKKTIPYLNTYFLVLAGGIGHIYLDSTMNYGGYFFLIPQIGGYEGLGLSLVDFIGLLRGGIIEVNPIISVSLGIFFILGFIYVFTWAITKYTFKSGLVAFIHILGFMIYFYLVGGISTGEHGDAGAIIYVSLYWLPIIILCTLSTKSMRLIKKDAKVLDKSEEPKSNLGPRISRITLLLIGFLIIVVGLVLLIFYENIFGAIFGSKLIIKYKGQVLNASIVISIVLMGIGALVVLGWLKARNLKEHHKNLFIISSWLYLIGLLGMFLALIGILLNELLVAFIFSMYGILFESYVTFEQGVLIVIIFGTLILILAILDFLIAFGLTIKNKFMWKFSIYYHLVLAWTVIGLTVACALSENEVKELFKSGE